MECFLLSCVGQVKGKSIISQTCGTMSSGPSQPQFPLHPVVPYSISLIDRAPIWLVTANATDDNGTVERTCKRSFVIPLPGHAPEALIMFQLLGGAVLKAAFSDRLIALYFHSLQNAEGSPRTLERGV